ncbi:MAG: flagellar hook-basal body complex protein [Alphaproteobacteria bacterium]|nr:MAG: flagellar hook-basal body complex protein [Alphaproteobacteria bacterium]
MSVTGSLFSSVTGLKSQAQGMGIISDNIANSNTVGYKNARAQFQTLVTQSPTATTYSPGGALTAPRLDIDKQGLLQASASATDIGVIGRGMFVVSDRPSNANGTLPIGTQTQFTRAGSFQIDKSGNLVNTGGKYLLGVPTNAQGQPTISNPAVTTLRTVNVGNVTGSAKQTNLLRIAANLPAVPNAPSKLTISGVLNTAGAAGQVGQDQGAVIYSSNGSSYKANLRLQRINGTTYEVRLNAATDLVALGTSSALSPVPTFPYTLGTITLQNTGTPTLSLGNALSFADGSSLQPTFDVSGLRGGVATTPGVDTISPIGVDQEDVTTVVYDSLGVAHNLTLSFFRNQDTAANPPAAGDATTNSTRWGVMIKDMRIAATGAPSVRFPLAAPNAATVRFPIYLDGSQATLPAVGGNYTTIPATSVVTFNANGTQSGTAPTRLPFLPMTTGAVDFGGDLVQLDLGQPNTTGGLTNYSNQFGVSFIQQDGIPYGFRTGVSFSDDGIVRVLFDNGQSLPVFRLPIATFAAMNRLEPVTGNAYRETLESGSALTNYAGVAGSGKVSPSTLEASTVDLSEEFTNMIIVQRSYSANARSITTADEMLGEVVNLKR